MVKDVLNAHIVKECITPKIIITHYMASLTGQPIFPKLKVLSQNSLLKNIRSI